MRTMWKTITDNKQVYCILSQDMLVSYKCELMVVLVGAGWVYFGQWLVVVGLCIQWICLFNRFSSSGGFLSLSLLTFSLSQWWVAVVMGQAMVVGCVVAYDGIDFDGVFNVVFIFIFYFILFFYMQKSQWSVVIGGFGLWPQWMWVVVMEMIVNEVWGSKEREREVLSLEKLNNFF